MTAWFDNFLGPDLHPRWEVTYGARQEPNLTGNVHVGTAATSPNFDLNYRFSHMEGYSGSACTFIFQTLDSAGTADRVVLLSMFNNPDEGVSIGELVLSGNADPKGTENLSVVSEGTDFHLGVRGSLFSLYVAEDKVLELDVGDGFETEVFSLQAWYDSTLEHVHYIDAAHEPYIDEPWFDDFTSPELHSRWTLLGGSYNPPGLIGDVAGPIIGDGSLIVERASQGDIFIAAINEDTSEVTIVSFQNNQVLLSTDIVTGRIDGEAQIQNGPIEIRFEAGKMSIYQSGVPLIPEVGFLEAPHPAGSSLQISAVGRLESIEYAPLSGDPTPEPSPGISNLYLDGSVSALYLDGAVDKVYLGHDLIWPATSVPVNGWTDDLTSPELHERWTLSEGTTYSPPGLFGVVEGPVPSKDFELTIEFDEVHATLPGFMVGLSHGDLGIGLFAAGSPMSGYNLMNQDFTFAYQIASDDYYWPKITFQRLSGVISIYINDQIAQGYNLSNGSEDLVDISAAPPNPTEHMSLTVGGGQLFDLPTIVKSITYREL